MNTNKWNCKVPHPVYIGNVNIPLQQSVSVNGVVHILTLFHLFWPLNGPEISSILGNHPLLTV